MVVISSYNVHPFSVHINPANQRTVSLVTVASHTDSAPKVSGFAKHDLDGVRIFYELSKELQLPLARTSF